MKKLLLILLCLPLIGFGQIFNSSNDGDNFLYIDLLNFPGILGQKQVITDVSFQSKKISTGSFGYESSVSIPKLASRLNYGIDFFQYKLLDKTILQNIDLSSIAPTGTGGLRYSYYRLTGGLGKGLFFTKFSSSTLNIDASAYFNQKGGYDNNITFTTFGIDINLKSNFNLLPESYEIWRDYQFKLGYYLLVPKLSSNMLNEGYSNGMTQLQQSYIEMPKFYVSLKKTLFSSNKNTQFKKSKKSKIKNYKSPKVSKNTWKPNTYDKDTRFDIQNISVSLKNEVLEINYDITGSQKKYFNISLNVLDGKDLIISKSKKSQNIYGDIGRGILSGYGKAISWKVLEDDIELVGDNLIFSVEANLIKQKSVANFLLPGKYNYSVSQKKRYLSKSILFYSVLAAGVYYSNISSINKQNYNDATKFNDLNDYYNKANSSLQLAYLCYGISGTIMIDNVFRLFKKNKIK